MKRYALAGLSAALLLVLASCGTMHKGYRADDPYLYKRGPWNLSKGGIVDDIPQFLWQMCESMFDFGKQPIDPPSPYESEMVSNGTSAVMDGRPEATSEWASQY